MRKTHRNAFAIMSVILSVSLACFLSCKKSDDSDDEAQTTTDTSTTTGGGSTASTMSTDSTTANLRTAEENMIPGSLGIATALRLAGGEDPCEGTDGLFDCQPNLLKLYLAMAKNSITITRDVVGNIGTLLTHLSAGASGSIDIDDSEDDVTKIDYDVTSFSLYKILIHSSKGVFLYLSVDETKDEKVYDVKLDSANVPGDEESNGAVMQIHLLYTDENDLHIESSMTSMACEDDDVRAPGSFVVRVNKENGVWQGKAMMYSPRWLWSESFGDVMTCASEPTSTSKMNFFTDFVGNDTNTTAALYMMPSSISDVDQFASYTAADFCTNYPSWCVSGHSFGDANPISSYSNPFCVDGATSDSTWGGACSSSSEPISTPSFSAETDWTTPNDLQDLTITLPTTLE